MQTKSSGSCLALTMGDPAGIGIEITLKAWLGRAEFNVPEFCLLADADLVVQQAGELGLDVTVATVDSPDQALNIFDASLPVLNIPVGSVIKAGEPQQAAAGSVIRSIEKAVEFVHGQAASAVVTNPIAKSVLYDAGFRHPGHTEFLGELAGRFWNTDVCPVMMLVSEELRVVPVTVHIPLRDVPGALDSDLIRKTVIVVHRDLQRYFDISDPRIAVTGLNPHAGEGGALGHEETDIIIPAIEYLRSQGLNVRGPCPADTIFHAAARKTHDAVVAMYHDQALVPIKTLSFDEGVNATLGLPFVRTSPDHGTAFDIAGRGIANPQSLIHALRLARVMAANSRKTKE